MRSKFVATTALLAIAGLILFFSPTSAGEEKRPRAQAIPCGCSKPCSLTAKVLEKALTAFAERPVAGRYQFQQGDKVTSVFDTHSGKLYRLNPSARRLTIMDAVGGEILQKELDLKNEQSGAIIGR